MKRGTLNRGKLAAIAFAFAGLTGIAQAQPYSRCYWPAGPVRCCDQLSGIAKSECERRDTFDDYAPAGVTPSRREKQERAREQMEATRYNPGGLNLGCSR